MASWWGRLLMLTGISGMVPWAALAQGLVMSCPDVSGPWAWSAGGVVTIDPDGQAHWAPAEGAPPAFAASWICDETSGEIVLSWQQGVVDRLRATDGGARLAGANQHGVAVAGTRPAPAVVAAAPAGPVPPRLVGTWLLEMRLPTPQGSVAVVWRIELDGAYAIDAGPFSHAGRMTASGGQWQQAAETTTFEDGGSYELPNWATLITQGRFGPGRWHRREPALALTTIESDGQSLPSGLPALAEAALPVLAGWRPDASLGGIEFERPDSNRRTSVEVKLSFASPATGAGLVMWAEPGGARFFVHDVVSWPGGIPAGFMDLPTVWAIARQHGLLPPLERASLRIWQPSNTEPVLAWTLTSARGAPCGVNLDAITGALLEGDLSGYIADYNAQWEAAVAGLRRLFAQPRAPSYEGPSYGDSSSSSSSSSSSDSSSSTWDHDTGAQNAWGSGDMQAYDRIMSGTATGEDCSRYGC